MTRAMKDSGIEWIGEIPEDWEIKKIKYCANIYTGNSISDNEKDNYTNSDNAIPYVATKDINADTNLINYDNGLYIPYESSFKVAPENSTLLCIEGGSAGRKIAYTNQKVCFVNKLCCFEAFNCNSKFLYYICQSDVFLASFYLQMSGLIGGVSQSVIKNIPVVTPSMPEQQKIADFLDEKCSHIDSVLEKVRASIDEYKQLKQSVITQAVTKGIRPNRPMKDSGIEWIGEIPQDWEVAKIGNLFNLRNEKMTFQKIRLHYYLYIQVLVFSHLENIIQQAEIMHKLLMDIKLLKRMISLLISFLHGWEQLEFLIMMGLQVQLMMYIFQIYRKFIPISIIMYLEHPQ